MQNKLQELTDRLYEEGLAKGRDEGAKILSQARTDAEAIIAKAREEAEAIMAKAAADAADLKAKAESDIRMASAQTLQATKKDIENIIVTGIVDAKVDKAISDKDFVKEIIRAVATNFSSEGTKDLSVVLPESYREYLEPFVKNELTKVVGNGVDATFTKKIAGGFTIGPKDGSYFISMTDGTFKDLIAEYLRPVTKKVLFG